ncbi:PorT family protein [Mucilaginibacter corticis]|uniref:PorT family protein n=1 Tax=Mucilaginibacter corticis TaxID=2597670 RepID=A0A556MWT3_9SPHI|nr:outer membrane beta-barrel protein [Mucilaginibacter corticis]TSJ44386.1 PorT family protein [Mucilaginibacter corticis]
MKNQEKYLKLWQQKRDDLHVDMDAQADWSAMHQLLDAQMPVVNTAVGTQSLLKTTLLHIAKFKLLYTLAALLTAGTLTYFAVRNNPVVNKKHNHHEINKISGDHNTKAITTEEPVSGYSAPISENNNVPKDAGKPVLNTSEKAVKNVTDKTVNAVANNNSVTSNNTSTNNNRKRPANNLTGASSTRNSNGNSNTKPGLNNTATLSSGNGSNLNSNSLSNISPNSRSSHLNNNHTNNYIRVNKAGVKKDQVRRGTINTGFSGTANGESATGSQGYSTLNTNPLVLQAWPPQAIIGRDVHDLAGNNATSSTIISKTPVDPTMTRKLASTKTKNKSSFSLPFDWGILAGINTPGSFGQAKQNNSKGMPFDMYGGLFATYNLNNKWAINLQTRLPVPHLAKGSYLHTEEGKTDTGQAIKTVNSKITDSRKMYTTDIALHMLYSVAPNIGVKAGPVLSIPLTQANGVSVVSTTGTPKDTIAYYSKLADAINGTSIEKKIRYGISGGVSLNYKRFLLDATYYHDLQKQKVSSSLGGYTSNTNNLQIAIGFRLNKKK